MVKYLIGLGLLLTPFASAHAMFIEDVTLPKSSSSSVSSASSVSSVSSRTEDTSSSSVSSDVPASVTISAGAQLTRGQFTALMVRKMYTQGEIDACYWTIAPSVPPRFTLVFNDVHVNDTNAKELCVAMRDGLIRGYGDGSFKPNNLITFAEAAKILSRSYALAPYAEADTVSPWYFQYVNALASHNAIPVSITKLNQVITRAEADEMLDRVHNNITSRVSQTAAALMPPAVPVRRATPSGTSDPQSPSAKTPSSASASVQRAPSSAVEGISSSSKRSIWDLF